MPVLNGASIETLIRRAYYGGRKGRRAWKRLAPHRPALEAAAEAYFAEFSSTLTTLARLVERTVASLPETAATLERLRASP